MSDKYRSPFSRRDEDPKLHQPFQPGLHYFSPSLTPLLQSDEVLEKFDEQGQEDLMIHQLYAYLNFTVKLELGPVNEVAELLSHPAFLPQLHWSRRSDAIYIVRDESKHAQ